MFHLGKVTRTIAYRHLFTHVSKTPPLFKSNVGQCAVAKKQYPCVQVNTFCTMTTESNQDLNYEDVVKLSSKKEIILIDVREPEEIQETGKLPGSTHIPLGEIPVALGLSDSKFKEKYGMEKPGDDAPLVFSCRSGKRSRMALNKALEMGFKKSRHYVGGWLDWESQTKK